MPSLPGRGLALVFAVVALCAGTSTWATEPRRDEDLRRQSHEALLRATRFLVEEVSTRGGYLWRYLPDFSRRFGEMEAYDTQITVQPPGTPTMGQVFLEAYRATGDETFYEAAAGAARALVAGQLESGGWHYFIDFAGEPSLRRWHDTIGRNGWRLEEHQTTRTNATFDDNVTADATRFLLRFYLEKKDPAFRGPLDEALAFVLLSQYRNGGWPQRYPPEPPTSVGGPGPASADYSTFVTFNDDVIWENIRLLLDVYQTLGERRVLESVRRGMDVYLLTQGPAPQAGWAEQYSLDLEPAAARTYEPVALSIRQTQEHIHLLLRFYRLTGERKYLARIPEALDWLDSCRLPEALTDGGRFTHPTLVELGTNRPLFVHREGSNVRNGRYFANHDPRAPIVHAAGGGRHRIDLASLRQAYAETAALTPEDAAKDSPLTLDPSPSRASWNPGGWDGSAGSVGRPDDATVRRIIAALDPQGRWLTRHEWTSHPYGGDGRPGPPTDAFATTFVGDETDTSPFRDSSDQPYLSMGAYARNMRLLIRAIETSASSAPDGPGGVGRSAGTSVTRGSYTNPILPGDWSDPGLIRVGDDYYSVRSSFGWQPGLPIAHSRDLLHWQYVGHGFASHPKLLPGDTRMGIWGGELGWNPNTKQYLIYAPTRDGEVFVYSADRPEGPYEVRSLGANLGIDPGFFADDDGRLYFITNRALIHELEPDGRSIKRPVTQIDRTPYRLFEGPDLFKHGGFYYLLLSDGGTLPREPSTITSLRARSLEGPWESDPNNPVMFSTDSGARFESPAHGTLIDTPSGEWYLGYHAHEPAYYTLGRQFLMEPIEWTSDGWWRPVGGRLPSTSAKAPSLSPAPLRLQQSDEFDGPELGLQWFFTCTPDFAGKTWSLREQPGALRVHTQPGDLHALDALPTVFQQRVIDKAFAFETRVTFDARSGGEAAGLHMYHDPLMNLWLATTVSKGEKRITVGKHSLGVRQDLWSLANPYGDRPVHLRIVVADPETATFFHSPDGADWRQLGGSIYFGASGHHLRDGKRGDPDLGWVGRYKEPNLTSEEINGLPENQRQAQRGGNVWTAATFGVFGVQDGAAASKPADFHHFRVTRPEEPPGATAPE